MRSPVGSVENLSETARTAQQQVTSVADYSPSVSTHLCSRVACLDNRRCLFLFGQEQKDKLKKSGSNRAALHRRNLTTLNNTRRRACGALCGIPIGKTAVTASSHQLSAAIEREAAGATPGSSGFCEPTSSSATAPAWACEGPPTGQC